MLAAPKFPVAMLRVPLALEATNIFLHRLAHWNNLGSAYVDTASTLISMAIVFYAAWLASRRSWQVSQAMAAAFIVWAFSLVLVATLVAVELYLVTPMPPGQASAALAGYVLASLLVLPVVILVAVIAAQIAKRSAP